MLWSGCRNQLQTRPWTNAATPRLEWNARCLLCATRPPKDSRNPEDQVQVPQAQQAEHCIRRNSVLWMCAKIDFELRTHVRVRVIWGGGDRRSINWLIGCGHRYGNKSSNSQTCETISKNSRSSSAAFFTSWELELAAIAWPAARAAQAAQRERA